MIDPPLHSVSHASDVLRFVAEAQNAAKPVVLCLLTHVTGGTLRETGAMMAVTQGGQVCGYVSNGCVDGDIVFQAQQAMAADEIRAMRYGEGSPYKDITLPCGGTIDLVILPHPDAVIVQTLLSALDGRQAVTLGLSKSGSLHIAPSGSAQMMFTQTYAPKIKLRIAGRGAAMQALAAQAIAAGFAVHLQSPDLEDLTDADSSDHLIDIDTAPKFEDDPWTAVVFLFHDHDWEAALIPQALSGTAFYIGAMGSQRTQAGRIQRLKAQGHSDFDLERIRGPIGLIPAMRDANLLALSILAEIVKLAL